MNLLYFSRKLFYYTIFVLIIQTNLYSNIGNIKREYNQTKSFQGNLTNKSSVTLESLTPYGQVILVILSSLLGVFFLRDTFE